MITFKQFIAEDDGEKNAATKARELLGSADVEKIDHIPEEISSGAKHQGHKFVDTIAGPWIVTLFKKGDDQYVKADPPKDSLRKSIYFLPCEVVEESSIQEGAVKHAMMDMVERAIASRTKKGLNPNHQLALTQIAHELQKIDDKNLTAGMTYKQLRDMIRPMYDEEDHKTNIKESVSILDEVSHMEFTWAAKMDSVIGHVYPSTAFSYDKASKTFTSEISETRDILKQLWKDSADVGFGIRSKKTNNPVLFTLHKEHKDREGDITHWEFHVYNPKRFPELNGLKATVFND